MFDLPIADPFFYSFVSVSRRIGFGKIQFRHLLLYFPQLSIKKGDQRQKILDKKNRMYNSRPENRRKFGKKTI
jgi:hypothetical protein